MRYSARSWILSAGAFAALLAFITFAFNGQTASAADAKSGQQKRIIMLINGDDPFWDAMRAGMQDAERDFKLRDAGFKVEMDKNDATPKGQIDKLIQYGNQTDIAAVAISSTDAKNNQIANTLRQLRKQGIVVITIDSDMDRSTARDSRLAYLGTDNVIGGRQLGKAVAGLRPNGGKYAAFVGLKSAANAQERMQGLVEGASPKIERIEYLSDEFDLSTAKKNVRDALDRHPEIDTLVGIYAYNADAIAQTVKQRGVREKVKVVVFDAAPLAIRDMNDGLIDAMIVQDPYQMGYDGVRLMKAAAEKDDAKIREILPTWDGEKTAKDGDVISTGIRVVVPDAKSPLKLDMFEAGTKFFTLPEFKTWLNSHKLTGS
jgi:ribose transport system substrate-binding protein